MGEVAIYISYTIYSHKQTWDATALIMVHFKLSLSTVIFIERSTPIPILGCRWKSVVVTRLRWRRRSIVSTLSCWRWSAIVPTLNWGGRSVEIGSWGRRMITVELAWRWSTSSKPVWWRCKAGLQMLGEWVRPTTAVTSTAPQWRTSMRATR